MNSPIKSPELGKHTGSATLAPDTLPRPNATANQILTEQVRQLYGRGKAGSIMVFVVLVAVWLPFLPFVEPWTILPPLFVQFCAQYSFNALRTRYLNSASQETHPRVWGERYARICLLSGAAWGLAAVLWLPNAPFPLQALFCLVVAALALNSILSRHVYPRALIAYTMTSLTPAAATLAITGNPEAQITAGLALIAWSVARSGLRNLHRTSTETIGLRFENNSLIDRLAESTLIAEQKVKDAERAQSIARKASRSRRDFLSMVTHEIRSPLASLSGLAHSLGQTELDDDQRDYAMGVEESTRLLNRLVGDLADLTEMEVLSINLRPLDMSPAEITQAAVQVMRHEPAAQHLSIEVDVLPDTPLTIYNDPDRVKQTLVNLVARALRITETGGVIVRLSSVDIGGKEPGIRFSVTDTSSGMPPEEAARLFSQDEASEDRSVIQRRDVNLTICERLVHLMGGRIGADSNVGGGFTVWFVLGCALPSRSAVPAPRRLKAPSGQVVDFDRVYEIEQELGTGRIADHLNEAIDAIAKIQKSLADACSTGDLPSLKLAAEHLANEANKIGLTGLAETASTLLSGVDKFTPRTALCAKTEHLDLQLRSGTNALNRAYPALAR